MLAATVVGAFAFAPSAFADVTPASDSITVPAGGAGSLTTHVHVPALPAKADIEIAIDTTGSMSSGIAQAQAQATDLVNQIHADIPDAQFAVVDFKDFACDEPNSYVVRQSMTANATDVQNAINAMSAGGGCDSPEAYNTVYHNSYSEPGSTDLGFRPDSRKFVVVIGDAEPHGAGAAGFANCFDFSADPTGLNTATELAGMNAAQRTLFMVHDTTSGVSASLDCYQSLAAAAYSGSQGVELGTDLASQIEALIGSASSTVNDLRLSVDSVPAGADASWFSFTPDHVGPLNTPIDVDFTDNISVPACALAGDYVFDIEALADGGDVGHESITVTVDPGGPGCGGGGSLTLTKTADSATSTVGGTDGYTITLTNGGSTTATVRWIRDYLAKGFTYVPGSTTGDVTADPVIQGTKLIWSGPFSIAAGATFSLHFDVITGGRPRCVGNRANALILDPRPRKVEGTNGRIAQICVSNGGAPTLTKTADSPTSAIGGVDGYTVTLSNPTAVPLTIRWLRDYLANGFTYVPGSTTGTISDDPVITPGSSTQLQWAGPFTIAPGSSFSIHFNVVTGGIGRCASNRANALILDPKPRHVTGTDGRIAEICVS